MGLKEPGKREKANYGQYMMWKSENGPQQAQSNENKESNGLMASPWTSRMRNNVIRLGKPKEFNKSPWRCEVRKRAEEAQGKQTGLGRPRENKWDKGAWKQWNRSRMPKRIKWDKGAQMGQRSLKVIKQAEDAHKNKMGQRSPKVMKWAREAQTSMSTSPMIVLGYWNLAEGKHTIGPKEAKFAINLLWGDYNKTKERQEVSAAGITWRKEKPNQRKMTNVAGNAWRNKTKHEAERNRAMAEMAWQTNTEDNGASTKRPKHH